jgi:hypothetical protein
MKYITFKNKSQMKTKNVLIVAAIIISGILNVNGAFAQTPTNADNVTLNIKLNPIQTITVNAGQKEVNIIYSSIDDYTNGVSVPQDDHIQVFSTGGFQVKVNSAASLTNDKGTGIDATDVTVLATNGTANSVKNTIVDAVALGSEQTLIASATGGRNLNYNVTYNNTLGAADKYLNLYDKDANNVFKAEVTYTIIAN